MKAWLVPAMLFLAGPVAAATWNPDNIALPPGDIVTSLSASGRGAAADSQDVIHIVMQGSLDETSFEVLYARRSVDGIWTAAERISGTANAQNPSLALDEEGGVHAIWEDVTTSQRDIVYRYRSPEGEWAPARTISIGTKLSRDPVIAVDSFGTVHAIWVDAGEGTPQIVSSRKAPGSSWEEPVLLSVGGTNPDEPTIAADGVGNIHVAWSDRVGSAVGGGAVNHEIFYLVLGPDYPSEFRPVRLTSDLGLSLEPFLETTPDGTVHLVWIDNRTSATGEVFDIFYRRFLPGVGWGKVKRFSYDEVQQRRPVISAGANHTLNVAWEDFTHGNPEIYYRQITVETGWDPLPTRLTNDEQPSVTPALVALSDGGLVLLWADAENASSLRVYAKDGLVGN